MELKTLWKKGKLLIRSKFSILSQICTLKLWNAFLCLRGEDWLYDVAGLFSLGEKLFQHNILTAYFQMLNYFIWMFWKQHSKVYTKCHLPDLVYFTVTVTNNFWSLRQQNVYMIWHFSCTCIKHMSVKTLKNLTNKSEILH